MQPSQLQDINTCVIAYNEPSLSALGGEGEGLEQHVVVVGCSCAILCDQE